MSNKRPQATAGLCTVDAELGHKLIVLMMASELGKCKLTGNQSHPMYNSQMFLMYTTRSHSTAHTPLQPTYGFQIASITRCFLPLQGATNSEVNQLITHCLQSSLIRRTTRHGNQRLPIATYQRSKTRCCQRQRSRKAE